MHELYNWEPLFTRQISDTNLLKQITVWKDIIIEFCSDENKFVITPSEDINSYPFTNTTIDRSLTNSELLFFLDEIVKLGHGIWANEDAKARFLVLVNTVEEYAELLYKWIESTGQLGSVLTVWELTDEGDTAIGTDFEGLERPVIDAVLNILVRQGKCAIIPGDTAEDDGVKFQ
ncbi:hypothetical protein PCE1_000068 [Barthelona sp. PCE]